MGSAVLSAVRSVHAIDLLMHRPHRQDLARSSCFQVRFYPHILIWFKVDTTDPRGTVSIISKGIQSIYDDDEGELNLEAVEVLRARLTLTIGLIERFHQTKITYRALTRPPADASLFKHLRAFVLRLAFLGLFGAAGVAAYRSENSLLSVILGVVVARYSALLGTGLLGATAYTAITGKVLDVPALSHLSTLATRSFW